MVAGLPGDDPRRGSSKRGTAADPALPLLIGSRLAKKIQSMECAVLFLSCSIKNSLIYSYYFRYLLLVTQWFQVQGSRFKVGIFSCKSFFGHLCLVPCAVRLAPCAERRVPRAVRLVPFLILCCLVPVGFAAHAASLTLAWDANNEPDLAGYKVYYGTSSGSYGAGVDVGDTLQHTFTGLNEGVTYYFAARAYADGNQSAYSEELSHTVGLITHTIGASAEANGSISPSGSVVVNDGGPAISRALHNKRNDRNSNIANRRRFIFSLHLEEFF